MKESKIKMIDISGKEDVLRIASAEGKIFLKGNTINKIKRGEIKKGDVLTAAKLAAISGVKKTPEIVVLAHPIPILSTEVEFDINELDSYIIGRVKVKSMGKTGVELEALSGLMIALLTIWDFTKYLEKDSMGQYPTTHITDIRVIEKKKSKK